MHVRMRACARTCVRVFVDMQAIQLLIPSNIQRCRFDACVFSEFSMHLVMCACVCIQRVHLHKQLLLLLLPDNAQ